MNEVTEERPVLRLVPLAKNVVGPAAKQIFLIEGDATQGPVDLEIPAGVQFPDPWRYDQHPFRLKVLHFNDLHGHIAHLTRNGNNPIFSKMAGYIRQAQSASQEDPYAGVLSFSGGDDIVGSPFYILTGGKVENYQVHASYRLFTKAGVDATVIGNHEFDLGLDLLAHAIRSDAGFPVLSANLRPTAQLQGLCYPAAVFAFKGIRVGVIGLTTSAENRSRAGSEFEIVDPLPVMNRLLPLIRPLSDVVILLSHLGRSLRSGYTGDVELAQQLPKGSLDLIIGAHTHDSLNENGLDVSNVVNGIPIVQAGSNGRCLGEVDIVLRNTPIVAHLGLQYTEALPVDAGFEEKYVQPLLERIRPYLELQLGKVSPDCEINTNDCCDDAAYGELALHNFVTDSLVLRSRVHGYEVDLAMLEASAIRDGLQPGGILTNGDWLQVMPYPDTLVICTMTGAELYELIRDNACRIDLAGEPHIERGFLHFSQEIRYRIRLDAVRSKIQAFDIQIGGLPIEKCLNYTYRVACTSFFRGLSRRWEEIALSQMPVLVFHPEEAQGVDTGLFVGELVLERIRQLGGISPQNGAVRDSRMIVCW